MYRNLSKRIEVVTPVTASPAKERLWEILDICLRDRRQAWLLGSDGRYTQFQPEDKATGPELIGSQETLMELTQQRIGD